MKWPELKALFDAKVLNVGTRDESDWNAKEWELRLLLEIHGDLDQIAIQARRIADELVACGELAREAVKIAVGQKMNVPPK